MTEYLVLTLGAVLIIVHLFGTVSRLSFRGSDVSEVVLEGGTVRPRKPSVSGLGEVFAWLIVAIAFALSFYMILTGSGGSDDRKFAYGTVGMCLGVAIGRLKS